MQIQNLLRAILTSGVQCVFTKANADPDGNIINMAVQKFVEMNSSGKYKFIPTLGRKRYFSALKYATLMLGNSSSGIIEAASFALPVVNIGNRQKGRVRGKNIIDVENSEKLIQLAIQQATSKKFIDSLIEMKNPYYPASEKLVGLLIKEIIKKNPLPVKKGKSFYNIRFEEKL